MSSCATRSATAEPCPHERCSGRLRLEPPVRLIVIAELYCDVCAEKVSELARVSAEATATSLLALPRLLTLAPLTFR